MSQSASDSMKDLVIVVLAAPFVLFFAAVMSALPLMLGLGVAHAELTPRIPALGFWATLVLSWALGTLVSKFKPTPIKRGAK